MLDIRDESLTVNTFATTVTSLLVLERIATALKVELLNLFQFAHEETNPKTRRKSLDHLLAAANAEQLQMACKLPKALLT